MSRTIHTAALGVLALLPEGQSLTVEDTVVILREQCGFPADRAYYQPVYSALVRHLAAGHVTRERDSDHPGPWQYRLSDSMRAMIDPAHA